MRCARSSTAAGSSSRRLSPGDCSPIGVSLPVSRFLTPCTNRYLLQRSTPRIELARQKILCFCKPIRSFSCDLLRRFQNPTIYTGIGRVSEARGYSGGEPHTVFPEETAMTAPPSNAEGYKGETLSSRDGGRGGGRRAGGKGRIYRIGGAIGRDIPGRDRDELAPEDGTPLLSPYTAPVSGEHRRG